MSTTAFVVTGRDEEEDNWRMRALCGPASPGAPDPDLFFPVGDGQAAWQQAQEAKVFCRACPVHRQCLTWALETHQQYGVWGGLDEWERRTVRRRRQRAALKRQQQQEEREVRAG